MEMQQSYLLWAAVAAIFLVAGLAKGVVGLGLPTVSVAMLSLVMSPLEAAAILIIPSLVTNVWQMLAGPGLLPLARRFWPLLLGILAGTLAAGAVQPPDTGNFPRLLLGILLVVYGISGFAAVQWEVRRNAERMLSPVAGAVTGAVAAVTGVFVIPAVPFLQALNLPKDALVQALGLVFTVSTVALAIMLGLEHSMHKEDAMLSVFALLPALAGMRIGQKLRQKLSLRAFRGCLFGGLIAIGLHLALRAM